MHVVTDLYRCAKAHTTSSFNWDYQINERELLINVKPRPHKFPSTLLHFQLKLQEEI